MRRQYGRSICTFEGCTKPVHSGSLCKGHDAQVKQGRTLAALRPASRASGPRRTCEVDGCDKTRFAQGLCGMHYQRLARHGSLSKPSRSRPVLQCITPGCQRRSIARRLCERHWRGWYRETFPEKWQAANRRRAERMRANGVFVISDRDVRRMVVRFRGLCAHCAERPFQEVDHVVPLARGGRHSIGNLLPSCAACNRSKQARLLVEWRAEPSH